VAARLGVGPGGSVVYVSDFGSQPASVVEAVPSTLGVLDATTPVSLAEHDQAELLRAARQGDDLLGTGGRRHHLASSCSRPAGPRASPNGTGTSKARPSLHR
jgi:hypothetical protein